jgi:hypothetical protein
MSYSKRTCHKCGVRKVQPNMRQEEIEYISGSSQAGLSTRAVIGATVFGSKSSARQIGNWISGNTKRQYKRRRLVWVCADSCSSNLAAAEVPNGATIRRSNQMPVSADKADLADQTSHVEKMFGEVFVYAERWVSLKSTIGDAKGLSDAEARAFAVDAREIELGLQRHMVILGEVYRENPSTLRSAINITIRTLNLLMWCVSPVLVYFLFS